MVLTKANANIFLPLYQKNMSLHLKSNHKLQKIKFKFDLFPDRDQYYKFHLHSLAMQMEFSIIYYMLYMLYVRQQYHQLRSQRQHHRQNLINQQSLYQGIFDENVMFFINDKVVTTFIQDNELMKQIALFASYQVCNIAMFYL